MKYSIFLAVLIWNSLAFSWNSRIRDYKSCTAQDTLYGKTITIQYDIDLHEDCSTSPAPYELGCSVKTPFLDIENSSCFKKSDAKVSERTEKGRIVEIISGVYKLNTPECSAATIPQEYLSNIVCHNIVEFREEIRTLKLIKQLDGIEPKDERVFFEHWKGFNFKD